MAAATLQNLTDWITTYAGPIIDAAMNLADTGPQGTCPVPSDASDASQRSPLVELAHRIATARAAGALPAAVTSPTKWSGAQPSTVAQNWANAIGTWVAPGSGAWSYPNW